MKTLAKILVSIFTVAALAALGYSAWLWTSHSKVTTGAPAPSQGTPTPVASDPVTQPTSVPDVEDLTKNPWLAVTEPLDFGEEVFSSNDNFSPLYRIADPWTDQLIAYYSMILQADQKCRLDGDPHFYEKGAVLWNVVCEGYDAPFTMIFYKDMESEPFGVIYPSPEVAVDTFQKFPESELHNFIPQVYQGRYVVSATQFVVKD